MAETTQTTDHSKVGRPSIADFGKQHLLVIIAGILAVGAVIVTAPPRGHLLSSLETQNVVRLLLIGNFFILLFFGRHSVYQLFRVTNSVLVPLTAMMLLLFIWIDAWGADELSREDRVIEDFSFLFPMVGTACLGIVGLLLLKRREFLTAAVSLLGAAVFFVIGMEEISWFQRVLDVESTEFFRNLNSQGEMNFHNMYTRCVLLRWIPAAGRIAIL